MFVKKVIILKDGSLSTGLGFMNAKRGQIIDMRFATQQEYQNLLTLKVLREATDDDYGSRPTIPAPNPAVPVKKVTTSAAPKVEVEGTGTPAPDHEPNTSEDNEKSNIDTTEQEVKTTATLADTSLPNAPGQTGDGVGQFTDEELIKKLKYVRKSEALQEIANKMSEAQKNNQGILAALEKAYNKVNRE